MMTRLLGLMFISGLLFVSACGTVSSDGGTVDSLPSPPPLDDPLIDDAIPSAPAGQHPTSPGDSAGSEQQSSTPNGDPLVEPLLPNLSWEVNTFYSAHGGYTEQEKENIHELLRRLKIIIASDEFVEAVEDHYARSQENPNLSRRLIVSPNVVVEDVRNETRKFYFGKFSNAERKAQGKSQLAGMGSIGGNWIGFPKEYSEVQVNGSRAKTLFHEIMHNMGYRHRSGVPNVGNYVVHDLYKDFDAAGRFDNDYFK